MPDTPVQSQTPAAEAAPVQQSIPLETAAATPPVETTPAVIAEDLAALRREVQAIKTAPPPLPPAPVTDKSPVPTSEQLETWK